MVLPVTHPSSIFSSYFILFAVNTFPQRLTHNCISDASVPWPPQDPTVQYTNQNSEFNLPLTPWTYENDALNPNLQPYNSHLRASESRRRHSRKREGPISSVPPYHPDYRPSNVDTDAASSHITSSGSETHETYIGNYGDGSARVRSGSEGYEVRPLDREEILRRYLQDQANEPGRYQVYVPEPEVESEVDSEENHPLGSRTEEQSLSVATT